MDKIKALDTEARLSANDGERLIPQPLTECIYRLDNFPDKQLGTKLRNNKLKTSVLFLLFHLQCDHYDTFGNEWHVLRILQDALCVYQIIFLSFFVNS